MISKFRLPATAAAIALAFFAFALPAQGQTIAAAEKPAAKPASNPRPGSGGAHVYLLRGLLNIFSLGMDDLAQKLEKRGVRTSVHNHAEWESLANDIAARYKAGRHGAVVLIGHSLGADAVMFMGEYLGKKGVPVALIVPFDGTGSFAASSNVSRVMNLTQRDYAYMRRGPGFRGELQNIDVSGQGYGHTDIDKSPRLHNMVINKVVGVVGRGGPRQAQPAPAEAKPASSVSSQDKPAATPAAAPTPPTPPVKPASATSGASDEDKADGADSRAAAQPAARTPAPTPAAVPQAVPTRDKPRQRLPL